ncbi:MAG TPA: hypothetical protein VEJ87_02105, partial [Acidimicrobiales bacterium]|nr:hypothetical protein [Acidimicrobiales bacterium]
ETQRARRGHHGSRYSMGDDSRSTTSAGCRAHLPKNDASLRIRPGGALFPSGHRQSEEPAKDCF